MLVTEILDTFGRFLFFIKLFINFFRLVYERIAKKSYEDKKIPVKMIKKTGIKFYHIINNKIFEKIL